MTSDEERPRSWTILLSDSLDTARLAGRFDPDHQPFAQGLRGRRPMTGEELMVQTSETDQLRQQLLQAQRLSSVGALASSVAHEFNNILTTIINYAKMGLRSEGDETTRTQSLEKILKGGQR